MMEDIKKLNVGFGCTYEDYVFLYGLLALIRPRSIVEIGTNVGAGVLTMAFSAEDNNFPTTIDSFDINAKYQAQAEEEFGRFSPQVPIRLHHSNSDGVKDLSIQEFDLGVIDGDHSYEGCKKDFENLKDRCKILLFHDVYACEGVKKFFNEINEGQKLDFGKCPAGHIIRSGGLIKYGSYLGWGIWRKI